jgi:hypothetical protein
VQSRNTTPRRWFRVMQSAEGDRRKSKEKTKGHSLDDGENSPEDDQPHEETSHGKTVTTNPVEIALGAVLGHQDHDASAAIQRRNRKKIEGAEEEVQGKENEEDLEDKARIAGDWIDRKELVEAPNADGQSGNDHEREVGCRAGEGHPGRTVRMTAFPERIVRSTCPTDHAASEEKAKDWDNDHAKGRPADMRDRIEGDLTSECGGGVSSQFCDEGVGRFVTCGGEKKRDVPDKAEYQRFGRKIRHRQLG